MATGLVLASSLAIGAFALGARAFFAGGDRQPEQTGSLAGRASVIDGDTIEIRGDRIRLHAIDAPESSQTCRDGRGNDYRCGQRAANALSDLMGARPVACDQTDTDRYGRIVAICRLSGQEINAWMVRQGHALAYRQYGTEYVADEDAARIAKRGMWSGEFVEPWRWRRGER